MRRRKRRQRQYLVYRYQYNDMPAPEWAAKRYYSEDPRGSYDTLPPTIMADPGIVRVKARTKDQAISLVKDQHPRIEEART